jgi:hypothetical protein
MKGRARALRYAPERVRPVASRADGAAECIGPLAPGDCITGVTAGQFSAIDALEHMVNECGPGEVMVSTWTTGIYDVQRAAGLKRSLDLCDVRFLLDRGTFEKSPKFAGPLIEALGVDAFRCLSVHAKVTIVAGSHASAVMRSSMNLNKNLRTEQFDINVEPAGGGPVVRFYRDWFRALWDESGSRQDNVSIIRAVYDRFRDGGFQDAPEADGWEAALSLDGVLFEDAI